MQIFRPEALTFGAYGGKLIYVFSAVAGVNCIPPSRVPLMPRRNAGRGLIGMDANVSARDLDRFDQLVPIHGAYTALVTEGLRAFLHVVEGSNVLRAAYNADIEHHLTIEDKRGPQRTIAIRVPTDLQSRFIALFPQWGATSWFIRRLLSNYLQVAETHSFRQNISTAVGKMTVQVSQPSLL